MSYSQLNEKKPKDHLLLVYENKEKLQDAIVSFLNSGLENDQLCIYAYVNLEQSFVTKLHEDINDFERHILNKELLLVELEPYKKDIINGNYKNFENLIQYLIRKTNQKEEKFISIVGDLVSDFFYEEKYDYWLRLEEWWQKKPFEGCSVCPYDSAMIEKNQQRKELLFSLHDDVVFC